MTNSSTPATGGTTDSAIDDAYAAGWAQGMLRGAIMALLPDEKNKGAFRQAEIADRLAEYAANAALIVASRKHMQFWPNIMPGGWPIPPVVPSDDESTWWPEINGWPCPPPHLRGGA